MADLTALDGSRFFVFEASGDLEAERAEGFFHEDVRHLSRWRLLLDGSRRGHFRVGTWTIARHVSSARCRATTATRRRSRSGASGSSPVDSTRTCSSRTSATSHVEWSSCSSSLRISATSSSADGDPRSRGALRRTWTTNK
jgi:hypothetical protein